MKVWFFGKIVATPDFKILKKEDKEIKVVNVRIATKGSQEGNADFYSVNIFGTSASFFKDNYQKNTHLMGFGRLIKNKYTNKNGVDVETVQINATEINLLALKEKEKDYNIEIKEWAEN